MTSPLKNPLAALAFGIATIGTVSLASAHPTTTQYPPPVEKIPSYGPGHYDLDRGSDYDLDDDGILEHVEIDYRHYDRDRDGVLERGERTSYWAHMIDMGKFGTGFTPADKAALARVAFLFDTDGDGRLTGPERIAITRIISARKMFSRLDRNRDNNVTRREARLTSGRDDGRYYIQDQSYPYVNGFFFWNRFRRPDSFASNNWVARSFEILDVNNNGRVSWQEVQNHLLRSFRRGY